MAYIKVDQNHRVVAASAMFHCGPNEIQVTLPINFNMESVNDWIYQNSHFTYSPITINDNEEQNQCDLLRKQIEALNEKNDLLTQCILEISQFLYGDD